MLCGYTALFSQSPTGGHWWFFPQCFVDNCVYCFYGLSLEQISRSSLLLVYFNAFDINSTQITTLRNNKIGPFPHFSPFLLFSPLPKFSKKSLRVCLYTVKYSFFSEFIKNFSFSP